MYETVKIIFLAYNKNFDKDPSFANTLFFSVYKQP